MKILLVEDDLEISKLLAEFLQENGYEVFCQYDGLHVLDCLRENNIDLILLDIIQKISSYCQMGQFACTIILMIWKKSRLFCRMRISSLQGFLYPAIHWKITF